MQDFVPEDAELELRTVRVASLKIIIPWLSLFSEPIKVQLQRVECRLGKKGTNMSGDLPSLPTAASGTAAPSTGARSTHSGSDSKRSGVTSGRASSSQAPSAGWLQGALTSILANAQVDISSLSLVYTHGDAQLSVTAERLGIMSCAEVRGTGPPVPAAAAPPQRDGLLPPPSPFLSHSQKLGERSSRTWVAGYVEPAGVRGLVRKRVFLHGLVVGLNFTRASGRRYFREGGASSNTVHPTSTTTSFPLGAAASAAAPLPTIMFTEPLLLEKVSLEARCIIALNPHEQQSDAFWPSSSDADAMVVPTRPKSEHERGMVKGVFRGHFVLSMVDVQLSHVRLSLSVRQLAILRELLRSEQAPPTPGSQPVVSASRLGAVGKLPPRPPAIPEHGTQVQPNKLSANSSCGAGSTPAAHAASAGQVEPGELTGEAAAEGGLLSWAWGAVAGTSGQSAQTYAQDAIGPDGSPVGASGWLGSWLGGGEGGVAQPLEDPQREEPKVMFCALRLDGLSVVISEHRDEAAACPGGHAPLSGSVPPASAGSSPEAGLPGNTEDILHVPVARLGVVAVTPQSSVRARAATMLQSTPVLQLSIGATVASLALHSTFAQNEAGTPVSCTDFNCAVGTMSVKIGGDLRLDDTVTRTLQFDDTQSAPGASTNEQSSFHCCIQDQAVLPAAPAALSTDDWSLFGGQAPIDSVSVLLQGKLSAPKHAASSDGGRFDADEAAQFVSHVALPVSRSNTMDSKGSMHDSDGGAELPDCNASQQLQAVWGRLLVGSINGTLYATSLHHVLGTLDAMRVAMQHQQVRAKSFAQGVAGELEPRAEPAVPNMQLDVAMQGISISDHRLAQNAGHLAAAALLMEIAAVHGSVSSGSIPQLEGTQWPPKPTDGDTASVEMDDVRVKVHSRRFELPLFHLSGLSASGSGQLAQTKLLQASAALHWESLSAAMPHNSHVQHGLVSLMKFQNSWHALTRQPVFPRNELSSSTQIEIGRFRCSGSLGANRGFMQGTLHVHLDMCHILGSPGRRLLSFPHGHSAEGPQALHLEVSASGPSNLLPWMGTLATQDSDETSILPPSCSVSLKTLPGCIDVQSCVNTAQAFAAMRVSPPQADDQLRDTSRTSAPRDEVILDRSASRALTMSFWEGAAVDVDVSPWAILLHSPVQEGPLELGSCGLQLTKALSEAAPALNWSMLLLEHQIAGDCLVKLSGTSELDSKGEALVCQHTSTLTCQLSAPLLLVDALVHITQCLQSISKWPRSPGHACEVQPDSRDNSALLKHTLKVLAPHVQLHAELCAGYPTVAEFTNGKFTFAPVDATTGQVKVSLQDASVRVAGHRLAALQKLSADDSFAFHLNVMTQTAASQTSLALGQARVQVTPAALRDIAAIISTLSTMKAADNLHVEIEAGNPVDRAAVRTGTFLTDFSLRVAAVDVTLLEDADKPILGASIANAGLKCSMSSSTLTAVSAGARINVSHPQHGDMLDLRCAVQGNPEDGGSASGQPSLAVHPVSVWTVRILPARADSPTAHVFDDTLLTVHALSQAYRGALLSLQRPPKTALAPLHGASLHPQAAELPVDPAQRGALPSVTVLIKVPQFAIVGTDTTGGRLQDVFRCNVSRLSFGGSVHRGELIQGQVLLQSISSIGALSLVCSQDRDLFDMSMQVQHDGIVASVLASKLQCCLQSELLNFLRVPAVLEQPVQEAQLIVAIAPMKAGQQHSVHFKSLKVFLEGFDMQFQHGEHIAHAELLPMSLIGHAETPFTTRGNLSAQGLLCTLQLPGMDACEIVRMAPTSGSVALSRGSRSHISVVSLHSPLLSVKLPLQECAAFSRACQGMQMPQALPKAMPAVEHLFLSQAIPVEVRYLPMPSVQQFSSETAHAFARYTESHAYGSSVQKECRDSWSSLAATMDIVFAVDAAGTDSDALPPVAPCDTSVVLPNAVLASDAFAVSEEAGTGVSAMQSADSHLFRSGRDSATSLLLAQSALQGAPLVSHLTALNQTPLQDATRLLESTSSAWWGIIAFSTLEPLLCTGLLFTKAGKLLNVMAELKAAFRTSRASYSGELLSATEAQPVDFQQWQLTSKRTREGKGKRSPRRQLASIACQLHAFNSTVQSYVHVADCKLPLDDSGDAALEPVLQWWWRISKSQLHSFGEAGETFGHKASAWQLWWRLEDVCNPLGLALPMPVCRLQPSQIPALAHKAIEAVGAIIAGSIHLQAICGPPSFTSSLRLGVDSALVTVSETASMEADELVRLSIADALICSTSDSGSMTSTIQAKSANLNAYDTSVQAGTRTPDTLLSVSGVLATARASRTQASRAGILTAGPAAAAGSFSDSEDNDILGDLDARIVCDDVSSTVEVHANACSVAVSAGRIAKLAEIQHLVTCFFAGQAFSSAFDIGVTNSSASPVSHTTLDSPHSEGVLFPGETLRIPGGLKSSNIMQRVHSMFPLACQPGAILPVHVNASTRPDSWELSGGYAVHNHTQHDMKVSCIFINSSQADQSAEHSAVIPAACKGDGGVVSFVGEGLQRFGVSLCVPGAQQATLQLSKPDLDMILRGTSVFCLMEMASPPTTVLHATCAFLFDSRSRRMDVHLCPLMHFSSAGHDVRLSSEASMLEAVVQDGCVGAQDWRLHLSDRPPSSLDALQAAADVAQALMSGSNTRVLSGSSSADIPMAACLGRHAIVSTESSLRLYSVLAKPGKAPMLPTPARAVPIAIPGPSTEPGTAIVSTKPEASWDATGPLCTVSIEPVVTIHNKSTVEFCLLRSSAQHAAEEPVLFEADRLGCSPGSIIKCWSLVPQLEGDRLSLAIAGPGAPSMAKVPLDGSSLLLNLEGDQPAGGKLCVAVAFFSPLGTVDVFISDALCINNSTDFDVVLSSGAMRDDGTVALNAERHQVLHSAESSVHACAGDGQLPMLALYCQLATAEPFAPVRPVWSGAVRLGADASSSPHCLPIHPAEGGAAWAQYVLQVPVFTRAGAGAQLQYVALRAEQMPSGTTVLHIMPCTEPPIIVHNNCLTPLLVRAEPPPAPLGDAQSAPGDDPLQIMTVCLPECGSVFVPPQAELPLFPKGLKDAAGRFRQLWQLPSFRARNAERSTLPALLQLAKVTPAVFADSPSKSYSDSCVLLLGVGEAPGPDLVPEVTWASTPVAGSLPQWLGQLRNCAPAVDALAGDLSLLKRHLQIIRAGSQQLMVVRALHCGRLHIFVAPFSVVSDRLTAASINDEMLLLHSASHSKHIKCSVGVLQAVILAENEQGSNTAARPRLVLTVKGSQAMHSTVSSRCRALVHSQLGPASQLPSHVMASETAMARSTAALQVLQVDNHLRRSSALVPVLLRITPQEAGHTLQFTQRRLGNAHCALVDADGRSLQTGALAVDVRIANTVQDDITELAQDFQRPMEVVMVKSDAESATGASDVLASTGSRAHEFASEEALQRWLLLRFDPIAVKATVHITRPVQLSFSGVPFGTGLISAEHILAPSSRLRQELLASVLADAVLSAPAALGAFDAIGNPTRVVQAVISTLQGVLLSPMAALSGKLVPSALSDSAMPSTLTPQKMQELLQRRASKRSTVTTAALDAAAALLGAVSGISASVARNLDSLSLGSEAELEASERRRSAGAARAQDDIGSLELAELSNGTFGSSHAGVDGAGAGVLALTSALLTGLSTATSAVVDGARGVVSRPARDTSSFTSVLSGVGAGAVGVVARPIAGVADAVWHASQGVLQATGRGTALTHMRASTCTDVVLMQHDAAVAVDAGAGSSAGAVSPTRVSPDVTETPTA